MESYVIQRHGMNRANQQGQQVKILGTVKAVDREQALDLAIEKWSCYNNQFFDAYKVSEARTEAANEAYTMDAMKS